MTADYDVGLAAPSVVSDRPHPAIAWSAVWAGAFVAVAVSLLLSLAAAGIGFDTGLPGLATRASLKAFTPEIGAGAILIQVLASALGGYVAGRTRTVWTGLHDDESHFRDTAHGLVVWAVATVAMTLLAALVLAPYAEALASAASAGAAATPTRAEAERAANIAAQASLFTAIGMVLSAFVAAIAARVGGLRHEEMHVKVRR
jgi:hypothetical protein